MWVSDFYLLGTQWNKQKRGVRGQGELLSAPNWLCCDNWKLRYIIHECWFSSVLRNEATPQSCLTPRIDTLCYEKLHYYRPVRYSLDGHSVIKSTSLSLQNAGLSSYLQSGLTVSTVELRPNSRTDKLLNIMKFHHGYSHSITFLCHYSRYNIQVHLSICIHTFGICVLS